MQHSSEGLLVTADSPIKSLADIKDVTIGLASDKDLITATIALGSVGATLEGNHIKTVVVGESGPVLAKALRDGEIKALAGSSSEIAALQAVGMELHNITPIEVLSNPANSLVVWGPTLEQKRSIIEKFARGWAMAQHAGVVDTKLTAAACRTKVPEAFEDLDAGMQLVNTNVYVNHLRRTMQYGELEFDVWKRIQPPLVKLGELKAEHDPAEFLDTSFLKVANDWTTDDIKKAMNTWRNANKDKLIP
jgi:NitT/TauT family transport system substrate-binding protein